MVYEAYWSRSRLFKLAFFGLAIACVGLWIMLQDNSYLEGQHGRGASRIAALADLLGIATATMGRILASACLALGLLVALPVFSAMKAKGPAIRIDEYGVLCARRSSAIIAWSNIASATTFVGGNQQMIRLTLRDPALNPSQSRMRFLFSQTDVVLSLHGTDGNFEDLRAAVAHNISVD